MKAETVQRNFRRHPGLGHWLPWILAGLASTGLLMAGWVRSSPPEGGLGLLLLLITGATCAWARHRRHETATFPALLQALPDGLLCLDACGTIVLANPAMERLAGYAPGKLQGLGLVALIPTGLRAHDPHKGAALQRFLAAAPQAHAERQILRANGEVLAVEIAIKHWEIPPKSYTLVCIRDRTAHKHHEEALQRQASHDALTGLLNRHQFLLELDTVLVKARQTRRHAALLFLDLDHFKEVNDTHGHATGDLLLIEASQRMRTHVRHDDVLARLGGDEFTILIEDMDTPQTARQIAEKLLQALALPYKIHGLQLQSSCSIGMAFFPQDASSSEALLHCADQAMYLAKRSGHSHCACYDKERMDTSPRTPNTPTTVAVGQ